MSADRHHQEGPLRLSVGRPGILSALGKYLITGDKLQAPQVVATFRDPLALASGHPQALHFHHPHHPFLHLLIMYHPTNSTHCLNSLPSNQYLMTLVLGMDKSGTMSHPFSLSSVEDMAVEGMVLDGDTLEEGLEVVWPLCSQALLLTLLKMVTTSTSLMATGPILWFLHVLPNHHFQMVWTTDTPTVSTTRTLLQLSLPPLSLPLTLITPLLW